MRSQKKCTRKIRRDEENEGTSKHPPEGVMRDEKGNAGGRQASEVMMDGFDRGQRSVSTPAEEGSRPQ